MKPNTTDVDGQAPRKTQNLSRFHPRSSVRPDEGQELPVGGDLKDQGSWVHTPSGLRPPPNSSRSAEFPLRAIPTIVVPKPKPASPDPVPTTEFPLPGFPAAQCIPEWLVKETALALKVGLVALFLLGAFVAFKCGEYRGRKAALREVKPAPAAVAAAALPAAEFPEALLPELDASLRHLREGDNLNALDSLNKMLASHPKVPSLQYAAAIAALQSGYPREADRLADASIKEGFRVSDSWALKAAIAAAQAKGAGPDQETLLKKAIASDPMNPAPFVELSSLLRHQGRSVEAAGLLESAAFRLNPADAQTVVETTRAILAVEVAENLVPTSQPLGIPAKDIPNAYSEMKRGNFENAAAILRFCRDQTPTDVFGYLVNDPALRKFTSRPELREFY
ncbi:MAG: hypothetical protein WCH98_08310 [Verrucomicrobiota bacterium]